LVRSRAVTRTDLAEVHCSIARTMEVLGDTWGALILRDVFAGITRFDAIQADLGISRKVLAARLDELVARGILARRPYSEHPPRFDYVPTKRGRDLHPVLLAIMAYGDRWLAPDGPPVEIRHAGCGHRTTAVVACGECGVPLTAGDAVPQAGPGARTGPGTRRLTALLAARTRL
jgi:DNA-binding HxlR family transcriptional regulator